MKTILLAGYFVPKSGKRQVIEDLAVRLRDLGWGTVTTSTIESRPRRLADMLLTTWRTRGQYQAACVDVFSGAGFLWAELVCTLLRWFKKPYVLVLRGGNLPEFSRRHPGRVRRMLGAATMITSPSRYLQDKLSEFGAEIEVLPNPIDISAYVYQPRRVAKPRLMWLRAFHEQYNPSLAAEVIGLLHEEFPDIHLTMVGPDKGDGSQGRFEARARELGVTDHIACIGGIPKQDVPSRMQKADIFLNTTNIDNTPVSVMEAMACGLCVVTTSVGGIPYLLDDHQDALLVPPNDAKAMADAVRAILTDAQLAECLSRTGRAKVEGFDWSRVMPRWNTIFSELTK